MSNYSKLHSSYTCHKLSTMHCFTWIFVENCSILNFSIQRSKRLGSSITDFNFGRPVRKNTTSLLHQCITKSAWSRFLRCVHKLMDDPFVNCLTSPRACSYSGRRCRRTPWRLLKPQVQVHAMTSTQATSVCRDNIPSGAKYASDETARQMPLYQYVEWGR